MPHYLAAVGKKVTHYLEQARKNLDWFKLLNEMQMFLYQHDINQKYQQPGQVLINSLWCWGADGYQGEHYPEIQWFSDDYLMQCLGRLYASSSNPMELFKVDDINNLAILVDLSILKALKGNSDKDLLSLLIALETNCIQPIVESRSCDVVLHSGGDFNYRYKPGMSLKRWRKPVLLSGNRS